MFRSKTTMHQHQTKHRTESVPLLFPTQSQSRFLSSTQFQSNHSSLKQLQSNPPSLTQSQSHYPSSTQFQSNHPSSTQSQSHYPSSTQFQSNHPSSIQFQSHCPSFTESQSHHSSSTYTPILPHHHFSTIRHNSSSSSSSGNSHSLQSQQTTYEPNLNHCLSPSSFFDDDEDECDENEMRLLTEVQIIDVNGDICRTQKMRVKDVFKLNANEKILVPVNGLHQPIKAAGGLCTRFMTLLLKQPNLCPPGAKNWKEFKKLCGLRLMIELRRRFSLPETDCVDKVLFSNFTEKLRTWKYRLKASLFKSASDKLNVANNISEEDAHAIQYTEEELLEALELVEAPGYFNIDQWEIYKSHLRSSTAKKLSQYGKKARAKQIHTHTTGAVSFARKKDEFKVKRNRDPSEVEFFEISHQTKKGSYVRDRTRQLMDSAKKEISKRILEANSSEPIDHEKRCEIERDVMYELWGPEKPGRPRGHGAGVTKSQVTKFSSDLRKLRGESSTKENRFFMDKVDYQSKKIESQSKQIESQSKQIETQSMQIETQSKQIKILESRLDECTAELQLFMTAFQDFYGTRKQQLSSEETREDFRKHYSKDAVGAASSGISGNHGPGL